MLKDEKLDIKSWSPLIYKFKEYVTTSKRLGLILVLKRFDLAFWLARKRKFKFDFDLG